MIEDSFDRAFKRMVDKKWDKIYILVDMHDTILKSTYSREKTYDFYPCAVECLQLLTKAKEIGLILWTSTYLSDLEEYLDKFEQLGIHFNYVNENPEVEDDEHGYFQTKPYFSVGIDDKFGFNADVDWISLNDYLLNKVKEGYITI